MEENFYENDIANHFKCDINDVSIVGSGRGGAVYSFKHPNKDGSKEFKKIVKILGESSEELLTDLIQQSNILKGTENTLEPIETDNIKLGDKEYCFQTFEYMETNLNDEAYINYSLDKKQNLNILLKLFDGFCSLHNKNIAHCDIKPENILLNTSADNVKIIDFDLTKVVDQDLEYELSSTRDYISPDLLNFEKTSGRNLLSNDVYALGITIYRFLLKDSDADIEDIDKYKNSLITSIPYGELNKIGEEFFQLLKSITVGNCEERITMEEAKNKMYEIKSLIIEEEKKNTLTTMEDINNSEDIKSIYETQNNTEHNFE